MSSVATLYVRYTVYIVEYPMRTTDQQSSRWYQTSFPPYRIRAAPGESLWAYALFAFPEYPCLLHYVKIPRHPCTKSGVYRTKVFTLHCRRRKAELQKISQQISWSLGMRFLRNASGETDWQTRWLKYTSQGRVRSHPTAAGEVRQSCPCVSLVWPDPTQPISWLAQPDPTQYN